MFSNASASRRLARLQRREELLRFRYMAEHGAATRMAIGAQLVAVRARQGLAAAFYAAVLNIPANAADMSLEARDALRLKQAIINHKSVSISRLGLQRNSLHAWEQARRANDFKIAEPALQKLIDSVREEARFKAKAMGIASPYEALLRSRTPGFSMAEFERHAARIEKFSQNALKNRARLPAQPPHAMPKAQQKEAQDRLLAKLGYSGKVMETAHPICLGTHGDVRIGMAYDEGDFFYTMLNAAHEGGHGLYRQSLPDADRLAGQVAGVAMDEAMALLIENHVARSQDFADMLAKELPPGAPGLKEIFARAATLSEEPVRIRADEVRYPLDVILRYRLEKEMIDGNLKAADLPGVWAREFEKLTGLKTPDDNRGVLQDVHWYGGEFGWFPNYFMGQIAAAQIYAQAEKELPGLSKDFAQGDFTRLRGWLHGKVYGAGARLDTFEIVEQVTGKKLDTVAWEKHVRRRYAPLFKEPHS
jgi:carboxypeptidase Taq